MNLEDVKIDGETQYYCRLEQEYCVIEASMVSDGAALIAFNVLSGKLWLTEACFLSGD